ncbi:membrane bound lytic murein transglycosylase [Legionella londiniensis]|uniref:Membrane bound lytic murein transglycosylase n=2 Tax=Legionella londiniensis TaxID=45068 RepID=A0A0W0VPR0_9GAMM|nr:membrane bound lytic murein transglycosylase [Legionella londiniensis]STX92600.1 membrane bound lytic murein transglycosylase [Legionella londiniensis]
MTDNLMRSVLIIFLLFTQLANLVYADEALLKRKDAQAFVNYMVKNHGFKREEVIGILREAQYQPQIIESMNKPFEKKNWDVYKALFLTPERVQKGIAFWRANQQTLEKAQQKFGVPAHIIVAIIGVETLYGERQGNYRVLDALSTLAFYYPKRSDFFTKELKEYLLLCREQNVSPVAYKGSYAGAIGKPQFMPSSYRFYAVDFTGKGKRDLINDDKDVIASVANYFHKHGWQMGEIVVQPALIKGAGYKKIRTNSKHPDYNTHYLASVGIKPRNSKIHAVKKAGLIELTTAEGQEYWLAYPNFYVITRYNTSPQYAMAVYLLAQELQAHWVASLANHSRVYG